jgi:hypothetical protein
MTDRKSRSVDPVLVAGVYDVILALAALVLVLWLQSAGKLDPVRAFGPPILCAATGFGLLLRNGFGRAMGFVLGGIFLLALVGGILGGDARARSSVFSILIPAAVAGCSSVLNVFASFRLSRELKAKGTARA